MNINQNQLNKLEERVEKVVEDPEKIIKIILRIINMGCSKTNSPIPDDKRVTFYEFVKYYGNGQVERAIENGWDIEKTIKTMEIVEMENRIRELGGFSDETLPEGVVIKYR